MRTYPLLLCMFLSTCAFRPESLASPEEKNEAPTSPPSVSWEQIKEAIDYCKTNGKVKKIYTTGKFVCGNGARFVLSMKKETKK
jgi:hypothetical protein